MITQAVVEFFKYKVVSSIIVLSCWRPVELMKFTRQISQHGLSSTFSCDPAVLDHIHHHNMQGVLYITHENDDMAILKKVKRTHFTIKYKWLIVGHHVPDTLRKTKYDNDLAFLKWDNINHTMKITAISPNDLPSPIHIKDVYVHPRDGIHVNSWAYWSVASGLVLTHERERILRRLDLKRYPLRIATPMGHFTNDNYDGTLLDHLEDESVADQDPGIRCGYKSSMLLAEALNAKDAIIINELWAALIHNDSMYGMLLNGDADLSGGILRILLERTYTLDYVMPIWPFRVGFTYLAERESSSNMYLEPFSPGVWWSCLAMMAILAMVERLTSKSSKEKEGALYTVLTTWLQQDASAVPEGASGRWAFMVMSVSAMLVHSYYTSAIVSALMSTGRGGPDSLKALADSKYMIYSEDYDYMRFLFFDVETTWDELEYLKRKKKTSKFYQTLQRGVELIQQGNGAFHTEYNQLYPHFKSFSDDHICKLQHVDTIPETLTWITTTKDGQWTEVLRSTGGWLLETGLGKRLVSHLRIPQPPCRAALLAERVKLGDIASLLILTAFGAFLSVIILGIEIIVAKAKTGTLRKNNTKPGLREIIDTSDVEHDFENS